ncbi:hypothetical protein [Plantactinospora sp. KBS50]|uniref:hypothetical protein n=1 Tax=Plantactinospora sp. KBS50 TaxID=2024580 RepID=UPI000BAACAA1|nr:hypothetical protein [Plantactinospora sp. KBS50]ASW57670.1 hypothetical protein CIK06_13675 [Plantactinospora sp. KBS50]
MMTGTGHPQPASPPRALPPVTGHVVRLMEGYPREIRVRQPVLVVVLAAATVARLLGRALTSVLRAGSGAGGGRRRFKELRKGPEFLVTPLRVRTAEGRVRELEIHGHLPQSALEPADHVQVTVRRQRDPELAPRVERIVNLTTGQLLTPRTPTLWSHLGPVLLLQAGLGVALLAVAAACTIAR